MRNRNSGSTPTPAGLRERVGAVVAEHTQAVVARKTGTPPSTIHRFLRGARIPGEFCASLVRELGVNPAWLLVGEGTPKLTDVAAQTSGMAKDLLALVAAMNEVARMRLGSLAGKHHLKVLRELNDALAEFERLRERMDENAKPLFNDLLRDYGRAISSSDMDRAEEVFKALSQVRRLCHDDDLALRFTRLRAGHLHRLDRREEGVDTERRVFAELLSRPHTADASTFSMINNLTLGLKALGRFSEAAAIAAFGRRLCETRQDLAARLPQMRVLEASVGVDSGFMRENLGVLSECFPLLDAPSRLLYTGTLLRALVLSGALRLTSAEGVGVACATRVWESLRLAIWLEDVDSIAQGCAAATRESETALHIDPPLPLLASAVRDALEGRRAALAKLYASPLKEQAASALQPKKRFERNVLCAQVAHLVDHDEQAVVHWREAQGAFKALPPDIQPHLLELSMFHRLALVLPGLETAQSASRAFLSEYVARGYGLFATWR